TPGTESPNDDADSSEVEDAAVVGAEVDRSLVRHAHSREVGARFGEGVLDRRGVGGQRRVEPVLVDRELTGALEVPLDADDPAGADGHVDARLEPDSLADGDLGPLGAV